MVETIIIGMKTGSSIGGIEMNFEYDDYYNKLYEMPLITIIIAVLMIFGSLSALIIIINKHRKLNLYAMGLLLSCVFSSILLVSGVNGFNAEIKHDKPAESIQLTRIISDIRTVSNPPRFYYEGQIVIPKIITIHDAEYYCMTIGTIKVGDNVEIDYMENSKVVLSINLTEYDPQ